MKTLIFTTFLFISIPLSNSTPQQVTKIMPGFEATDKQYINQNGMFLLSNNSMFSFGFYSSVDAPLFVLVIMHIFSSTNTWTANRGLLVDNSAKFVFDKDGNAYLSNTTNVIWSTYTSRKGVHSMELKDTGNLVILSENNTVIWQSFDHPSDTLLSGQRFSEGMRLMSYPNNLFYYLKMESGDLILYAGYETRQVYWSMSNDTRKVIRKSGSKVSYSTLMGNSWNSYDETGELVWEFNVSEQLNSRALWAIVLGSSGILEFFNLLKGRSETAESTKIPFGTCSTPSSCDTYKSCFMENLCTCPETLNSFPNCMPRVSTNCNVSASLVRLLDVGTRFDYPSLAFTKPQLISSLSGCRSACISNCSCTAMFYANDSRSCFMFKEIGSLRHPGFGSKGYYLSLKVIHGGNHGGLLPHDHGVDVRSIVVIIIIAIGTLLIVSSLIGCGIWFYRENNNRFLLESPTVEGSDEDEENFDDIITGVPVRYGYNDLQIATESFLVKLGQGGFGSVYLGELCDGIKVAVKKLEGIGQGRKEFRAEVSIIGSIHHVHLAKLKGFCAEGAHHRLLVYEYMENGSLDKWIFKKNHQGRTLDWETRFNIALGTAKGLAYLHEECDVKIIHCDIKPQNVLLDKNFVAKVSDFGLAKMLSREQSQVITTLRGTRGYLAPEWITNCTISEKSDVYSFGMVMLEIISGRKNYDPSETNEKAHLPSYAFKMMEERRLNVIVDSRLVLDYQNDERVSTAIKAALWCIQDDVSLRPSMTRVVQMLEGLCPVNMPPLPSQSTSRIYSSMFGLDDRCKTLSRNASYISDAPVSAVQLSELR
ncbi:G-type lectin S-receptor-like serine/threonine-protein kinase SD2-5 [Silene latifolia]|uniref:G-type lectin S-receptor-like serine/threonine-protein kinase SD2-5 n=1 Tax=Silene latifolia TaxID=37657 RepID=UPI003D774459